MRRASRSGTPTLARGGGQVRAATCTPRERRGKRLVERAAAHTGLKALAVGQFLAALSAGATGALLVVLAQQRLGGGQGYGLLVAAIGVGAAIGPLLLRKVTDPRRPLFVFGLYAVRGVVDLVLASVTAVPLAAAALVVYGLSTSTGAVTFSSLVQSRVPEDLRGRAFAGFDVLWQTGRMLSLVGGGLLADAAGIQAVYVLGGVLLLGAAAVGAFGARTAGGDLAEPP